MLAAAGPPQETAERSGKRGLGGGSPRLPNQASHRRSRAQRQAGVLRSVQRSTAGAGTTRNAYEGLRACICFQRSTYITRTATQRAALHSAQRCTARSAQQRSVLHSTIFAALYSAQHCTAPPPPPALHSANHRTAPSITLHRAQRAKTRPNAATEPSRLRKGGLLRYLVRLAPMKTAVRTPELAPCAKKGSVLYSAH